MSTHVAHDVPGTRRRLLRRATVWMTLACFILTHATAQIGPHAEGTAAGQAANPVARETINAPDASMVVPGYTTTPIERQHHGHPNLSGPTHARLAACAMTPNDPVCQALLGAHASANTPREPISPFDPAVRGVRRVAAHPSTALEDIASFYSGCQVETVATPASETRVCRQHTGASAQSCARTLSVSISRTSSCSPGEWFAQSSWGSTSIAIQCRPDQPASAQRMRVTSRGAPVTYFDVDANSGWVFPRRVADLPSPAWPPGGPNGVWIVNNQCSGNDCRLTAFIAREYRQICNGGGGEAGDAACAHERPFLEVYAACPGGTQSGDNIARSIDSDPEGGSGQTVTLDQATCYAPTQQGSMYFGADITGSLSGYNWTPHASRAVVGFRLNPLYGPVPQMALSFERPHTHISESDQWDDQCPTLASDGRCAITAAARCADGPATKVVNGEPVTRACWRYETSLSCGFGRPADDCAPLAASGCTPSGSVCRQMNAATGVCEITENSYACPVTPVPTATVHHCPSDVFCVAGNCFNTTYTGDSDFARSMSFLEAAREAGVYLDTDNLRVFRGEANRCRDRLLANCCHSDPAGSGMSNQSLFGVGSRLVFDALMNSGNRDFLYQGMQALLMGGGFSGSFTSYGVTVAVNGAAVPAGSAVLYASEGVVVAFDPWSLVIAIVIYVVMAALSCDDEEGKLAMKEGARLCHSVATYCSSCIRVLGRCVSCTTHTTNKCCFNSVLARIINQQGRQQIGKPWGTARAPDCSGFTIAELQSLDFARMDLTEFYASIVPNMPDARAMQRGVTERADNCYYGEGRCQ